MSIPVAAVRTGAEPTAVNGTVVSVFSAFAAMLGGLSVNELCGIIGAVVGIGGGIYGHLVTRKKARGEAEYLRRKDEREAEQLAIQREEMRHRDEREAALAAAALRKADLEARALEAELAGFRRGQNLVPQNG
jgi:hypothetical protein